MIYVTPVICALMVALAWSMPGSVGIALALNMPLVYCWLAHRDERRKEAEALAEALDPSDRFSAREALKQIREAMRQVDEAERNVRRAFGVSKEMMGERPTR